MDSYLFFCRRKEGASGYFQLDPGQFVGVGADDMSTEKGVVDSHVVCEFVGETTCEGVNRFAGAGLMVVVAEAYPGSFLAGVGGDGRGNGGHCVAIDAQ